ncbi:MAG TPA: hypothetical protein VGN51_14300 [Acidimicrobiia bacterium]
MLRRIASAAVVGAALLAAFGCGGGGNDASVSAGNSHDRTIAPAQESPSAASSSTVGANGLRTVTYHGVQFDVPGDWPVYDLAADPSTCVRFDVHAVYLGAPGADMNCPAGLVGRADAVLVEPTDGGHHRGSQGSEDAGDVAAATASGLEVQVATDSAVASEVAADLPSAGVSVTLTYNESDATAQQILQSFRAAP